MEHEKYFQYFDRAVLNYYRTNSHAYHLIEDDMGGEIRTSDNWDENLREEHPYIEFKFAFRKLANNFVCIGAFMPSFKDKISERDHAKWLAFHIKNPSFHKVNRGFERWTKRYMEGSWDVMDGPKIGIQRELKLINSITETQLKHKLFKQDKYRLVNYPAAENSEEYTKSILELYRLVIDGMEKDCLIKIAEEQNITLNDSKKRLNSFKEIIPSNLHSEIYSPFQKLNRKRMPIHGIPSKGITPFAAFETFNTDLESIYSALKELRNLFELIFDLDSESCLQRLESLSIFPEFDKPPRPEFKLEEALKMKGKTIENIEFGETKFHKDVHAAEGVNIYFTDGTAVSLQIGSNAYNIASDHPQIKPSDFHTDIMIFWAEKLRKQNEKE